MGVQAKKWLGRIAVHAGLKKVRVANHHSSLRKGRVFVLALCLALLLLRVTTLLRVFATLLFLFVVWRSGHGLSYGWNE